MGAAAKTSDHVGFSISGEWLTEFARTRMLENRWDAAYKMLLEDLHGIKAEHVMAILKGDAKLDGVNELGFVEEEDAAYKTELKRRFAGCYVTSDGRYMRPYAVVTSWGPEDMEETSRRGSLRKTTIAQRESDTRSDWRGSRDYSHRSFHYLRGEGDAVKVVRLPRDGSVIVRDGLLHPDYDVLFEPFINFPHLLVPSAGLGDAQGAVDAFLAAGNRLEETGYMQFYGDMRFTQATARDEEPVLNRSFNVMETDQDVIDAGRLITKAVNDKDMPRAVELSERWEKAAEASPDSSIRAAAERVKSAADNPQSELEQINATVTDPSADIGNRVQAFFKAGDARQKANETADAAYSSLILAQNGDDFLDMHVEAEGALEAYDVRVPRKPFAAWALRGTPGVRLVAWKPVAPQGLKMIGDDRAHSDWMIGAGLSPSSWQFAGDGALNRAAYDLRHKVQKEMLGFKAHVLCGSGQVYGTIHFLKPGEALVSTAGASRQIGVIPHAGPDYVQAAKSAIDTGSCLITAAGGAVAHLVTAFRDQPLRLIRETGAMKRYKEGMWVMVNFDKGLVEVQEHQFGSLGEV